MSIINNSHAIGVESRNLVLKTKGTLHVKVGDKYYEIDFRNGSSSTSSDVNSETSVSKDSIIVIKNKEEINTIEYPGDNKLVIGLDKSLFVTQNNTYVDVCPSVSTEIQTPVNVQQTNEIEQLGSVFVSEKLYGGDALIDFVNDTISIGTLNVRKTVELPNNAIKKQCCQTTTGTSYNTMDFIELVTEPEYLYVKSGVMIKSAIKCDITVRVGGIKSVLSFDKNGLYIIYLKGNSIVQTKLN